MLNFFLNHCNRSFKKNVFHPFQNHLSRTRHSTGPMTFIYAGADLLCNPVSSIYAVKKVETAVDNTRQVPKPKDATCKIFHTTKTTEVS